MGLWHLAWSAGHISKLRLIRAPYHHSSSPNIGQHFRLSVGRFLLFSFFFLFSCPSVSQALWQTLPEKNNTTQNIGHIGKLPVTVLWVFKLFYDTPAPVATPGARLAHNERLLIRRVERANQTLVRPRLPGRSEPSRVGCLIFSFARIMRPKLKWKW